VAAARQARPEGVADAAGALPARDDARLTWLAWATIAVLVWTTYGRSLHAPFVFDDLESVVENTSIRALVPLIGPDSAPGPLGRLPTSPVAGRPLVNLSFALNYRVGGLDPAGYRAVNITLHVLVGMLVFALTRRALRVPRFGGRFDASAGPLALAVALLWAAHPLVTEAVVYVTQRTELLVTLCYLGTIYASLRMLGAAGAGARAAWGGAAALACAAGMASKEVMVTAPVAVLCVHRTLIAGSFRRALREAAPLYAGLAAGWLVLAVVNAGAPRGTSAGFHVGIDPVTWVVTQSRALALYLRLVIWPHPLAAHYEFPLLSLRAAWPWAVGAAVLVAVILAALRRGHVAGLVGALALLVLSPTLLVPIKTEVIAERRMYLPLAILLAGVVPLAWRAVAPDSPTALQPGRRQLTMRGHRAFRAGAVAALAVALFAACTASALRLQVYSDTVVFWSDVVAKQPGDALAHYNLGVELGDQGRLTEAIEHFQTALRLDPEYPSAHFNLAVALGDAGRAAEAIPHFEWAERENPPDANFHLIYAITLGRAGRFHDAIVRFRTARAMAPADLAIHLLLADAYARAGRRNDAIAVAEEALRRARATGDSTFATAAQAALARHRSPTRGGVAPRSRPTPPGPSAPPASARWR
jgi:tetratricopeptide (TPR) repeat protein